MKFIKAAATALTIATASLIATAAHATVIDSRIETPNEKITQGKAYKFTITDTSFVLGKTSYYDALFSLHLTDRSSDETGFVQIGSQKFDFKNLDDQTYDQGSSIGNFYQIKLDPVALADLNKDGTILVSVNSTGGDFYFADSTLAVNVPEPVSVALLGAGLLGMGMARRRRNGK